MKQKFLILFNLESNPGYREIQSIIDYDQAILNNYEKVYPKECYVIKELELNNRTTPDQFYQRGDLFEWYTEDGRRYTDYELYLKGLRDVDKGLKYDKDGNILMKTDEEKMLDGEMELPENKEIYNGKIRIIPYFDLKKAFFENKEEFLRSIKSKIQMKYDDTSNLTVNLDGVIYKVNSSDISTLIENSSLNLPISWRALDNSMHDLDVAKQKVLAMAMQKVIQERKQTYFALIDKIRTDLNTFSFEDIINKIESILGESLDKNEIAENSSQTTEPIQKLTLEENAPNLSKEEIELLQNERELELTKKRNRKK